MHLEGTLEPALRFDLARTLDMTKGQAKQLVLNAIEASFAEDTRNQAMRDLLDARSRNQFGAIPDDT